jgi:hypothetical protein
MTTTVLVVGTPRRVTGTCARCGELWRGDALVVRPVAEGLNSFRRACVDCAPLLAQRWANVLTSEGRKRDRLVSSASYVVG